MSDAIEKYITHIKILALQEEIRTLRAELDTVKKERDEARREASRIRRHSERILGLQQSPSFPWENEG